MTGTKGAEFEASARAMVVSGRGRDLMLFPAGGGSVIDPIRSQLK